ncbi:hypothetical protein ACIGBN_12435 [Marinomonas sp. NPDC078689]|uniref:hypothetical protein n=1 Tax=Marinomonas sp. NPDC078689 TaxID=3364147 RepID=UPI0037CB4E89
MLSNSASLICHFRSKPAKASSTNLCDKFGANLASNVTIGLTKKQHIYLMRLIIIW